MRNLQSSVTTETQYPVISIGAAARAVCAGPRPPRPPRPPAGGACAEGLYGMVCCACSSRGNDRPTQANACATIRRAKARATLLNRVTGIIAPAEAIGFAMQRLQRAAMIRGRARRINRHDHFIAHLQRVALDALLSQLPRRAPFERPALHHALFIRRFDLQEGVRIAEQKVD